MERDFEEDDSFELFLQNKVDHYKMYPSEGVWKKIYNSLHGRRRWFTVGGSLLLLTGIIFITQEFLVPRSSKSGAKGVGTNHAVQSPASSPLNQAGSNLRIAKKILVDPSAKAPVSSLSTQRHARQVLAPVLKSGSNGIIEDQGQAEQLSDNGSSLSSTRPDGNADVSANSKSPEIAVPGKIDADIIKQEVAVDKEEEATPVKKTNWLQEMAVIRLTQPQKSRFNLQFYFSPTVSYRKLADGNQTNAGNPSIPMAVNHQNIDRFVDHVPSVGVELGSNVLYTAFENLTLKTGLQLNYSRYNIKAYSFYYEKASIAVNRVDTITAYTSLRNFNGYSREDLQNQYLQISMPVGAELKLLGNKRLQVNIAGTIQPTYLLFNDTYLLSMDYVNYAKEESLVRKWNVHTSVEAFVSYKMGGVRWQLGPQFRYQLMSSYNDRYPIKEYLREYGVKVGVSKTLK